jgi:membrane fusion protein (multidrug efflux system)
MIRYFSYALLGICILGGFAYKFEWFVSKKETTNAEKPENKPKPISSIKAYIVKKETLENKISVVGTLMPNEEVALTAEVAGKITQIFLEEGMTVSKGQVLAKLNDSELQAQAQRLQIQKQVLEQRRKRDEQLLQKQGISEQDWEILNGDIQAKQAEIELVKAQIGKTVLLAPFQGTIGLRYVSEGAFVATNTPIATLTDNKLLKLDFAVPEKYAHQISQGTAVEFTVGGNSTIFKAVVKAVETKIDANTRTLKVRAICNNTNNVLLSGSFTNVSILLDKIENTILIPSQALIPEMEAKKVYQIKNGLATSVKVEIGARTENKIQILSGLAIGDTIIYSGILQVKPNSGVKIMEIE